MSSTLVTYKVNALVDTTLHMMMTMIGIANKIVKVPTCYSMKDKDKTI